jgi:hypothetical protein
MEEELRGQGEREERWSEEDFFPPVGFGMREACEQLLRVLFTAGA